MWSWFHLLLFFLPPQSELPFLNSLKMKMSILLGVVHMNLGIIMSFFNNIYFKDRLSTICEFVPQVSNTRDCDAVARHCKAAYVCPSSATHGYPCCAEDV